MGKGPEVSGGFLRRHPKIKNTAVGVTGLAVAAYGFSQVDNPLGIPRFLQKLHKPHVSAGSPPAAESGVRQNTIEIEKVLTVSCEGQLSVGVDVHGMKDELLADGNLDKVIFGDFLYCGDKKNVSAKAKLTKDASGKVTNIVVETPGLEVTHPRVDHTDPRNCAPLRTKDTDKKIKEKINKMIADIKANKKIDCDNGYHTGGLFGGDGLTKIIPTANAAAQIAMAIDAQPGNIAEGMRQTFLNDLRSEVEAKYPGANVQVNQIDAAISARDRLNRVTAELEKDGYYKVSFETVKDKPVVKVSAPGEGSVTVNVRSIENQKAVIGRIEEQTVAEREVPPSTTIPPNIRELAQVGSGH